MRHKVDLSFQREHRDVVTVRLRRELEVRMHVDAPDPEGVGGQWLNGRVDHVIAECHMDLSWRGPGYTMACGDHVAP